MMKMRGKLAAALLAGAMTVGVMSIAAFAALTGNTSVTLTKNVEVEGDHTYAPVTTFNFAINPAVNGSTLSNGDIVYAGVAGGLYFGEKKSIANVSFDGTEELNNGVYSNYVELQTDLEAFKVNGSVRPGIYHYIVEEIVPADSAKYAGMKYNINNNKYDVYVYVQNTADGETEISYVVQDPLGSNADAKTNLVFTNKYTTYNATITKYVTGNQGDKNKDFQFTVSVTPSNDGETYEVYKNKNGTDTIAFKLEKGNYSKSVTLKDGEYITIYGLNGDKYTVTESSYSADGYKTYANIGNSAPGTNAKEANTVNNDGKAVVASVTENITNYKNASTPTGIVLNYAPYILIAVLAVVFAVMFLGRGRREEI